MDNKWINYNNKLENKNIYKLNQTFEEKIDEIISCLLLINNIFKYVDENEINNIKEQLLNCNIIFSTPILQNLNLDNIKNNNKLYSSCFLVDVDNKEEFTSFLKDMSTYLISGGIGINLSSLNNIKNYIELLDNNINIIYDNSNRKSIITIFIDIYHYELPELLNEFDNLNSKIKSNIYLGIVINDHFINCIKNNLDWYYIPYDINKYNILKYSINSDFKNNYSNFIKSSFEKENSQLLYKRIINNIYRNVKTYLINKDNINNKRNINNFYSYNNNIIENLNKNNKIRPIVTSNICLEIIQETFKLNNKNYYISCCNLGSINLSKMIKDNEIDYNLIGKCSKALTYSLSLITELYNDEFKDINKTHNISIGFCGLYDLFKKLNIDYNNSYDEQKLICETIFYNSIKTSNIIYNNIISNKSNNNFIFKEFKKFPFEVIKNIKNIKLNYNFEEYRNKPLYNCSLTALMPTSNSSEYLNVFQSFHGPAFKNFYKISDSGYSKIYKDENFSMTDLSLIKQLDFAIIRERFLDNTQSLELFIEEKEENQIEKFYEYFIKASIRNIPTMNYYIRKIQNYELNNMLNCSLNQNDCYHCNL